MDSVYTNGGVIGTPIDYLSQDRYTKYDARTETVLLLNGNGTNGGQNNTFIAQNKAAADSPGGYSVFFDGSGDFLTVPSNSALQLTGDFTVEAWVYQTAQNSANMLFGSNSGNSSDYFSVNATSIGIATGGSTSPSYPSWSATVTANQWHHVAVTRSGSTLRAFLNGTQLTLSSGSATNTSQFFNSSDLFVGKYGGTTPYNFTGYISNARIIKGTALYTSNFTVPTAPLTAISGTSLLTCYTSTITDGSPNNFTITQNGNVRVASPQDSGYTITRNGNTTQGSFSPYGDLWSNYFDGSDWLELADNEAWNFGVGNFTVEAWIYHTAGNPGVGGTQQIVGQQSAPAVTARAWTFATYGTSTNVTGLYGEVCIGGTQVPISASVTIGLNKWHHVAFVRDGSTLRLFFNGEQVATAAVSGTINNAATPLSIGRNGVSGYEYYFFGYISNLRIVKGTALYTTNFTPSTIPLTAITNTSLLTCQSNRFIDNSSNNFTITRNGDVSVQRFSPFTPSSSYSTATIGGSSYFDGSADSLSIPYALDLALGTGDFTVESWIYVPQGATLVDGQASIICAGWQDAGAAGGGWNVHVFDSTQMRVRLEKVLTNGTAVVATFSSSTTMQRNRWYHVAVTRSSGTTYGFIDGVGVGTSATFSGVDLPIPNNGAVIVGAGRTLSNAHYWPLTGYLSSVRVIKGTAVYTSNFTPATTPLSAITNTSLLMNFTNAAIVDNAMISNVETVGNAQINTTIRRYGTGSLYFDGSGDAAVIPPSVQYNFGAGDFTVEFWYYKAGTPQSDSRLFQTRNGDLFSGLNIGTNPAGTAPNAIAIYMSSNGSSWDIVSNTNAFSVTDNTWHHIALSRSGSTFRFFRDGVQQTTITSSAALFFSASDQLVIGGQSSGTSRTINGYIDDLRITKGVARYTANFAPPTFEFEYPESLVGSDNLKNSGLWSLPGVYQNYDKDLGKTASNPAISAQQIIDLTGNRTDGIYYINLPTIGVTPVYCLLDSRWNGGGWMMAMKATTGTTFNYSSNYWTTSNILNELETNRNNGDAKFHTMNYFQCKDIMALWPDITTNGGGLGSNPGNCWSWLENNFFAGQRTTLINFFNTAGTYNTGDVNTANNYGGYFKGLAKSSPNWASGVFSSQNAINFYGFNFKNPQNYSTRAYVRWGFGWNENGEGNYTSPATLATGAAPGSDDVSGGIGMDSTFGNFSAGDKINCCQDTSGINRSARVEVYIR